MIIVTEIFFKRLISYSKKAESLTILFNLSQSNFKFITFFQLNKIFMLIRFTLKIILQYGTIYMETSYPETYFQLIPSIGSFQKKTPYSASLTYVLLHTHA